MDIVILTKVADASDAESLLTQKAVLQFLRNLCVCLLCHYNLMANYVAQSWNRFHTFPFFTSIPRIHT